MALLGEIVGEIVLLIGMLGAVYLMFARCILLPMVMIVLAIMDMQRRTQQRTKTIDPWAAHLEKSEQELKDGKI